jgi:hypothetical protein
MPITRPFWNAAFLMEKGVAVKQHVRCFAPHAVIAR